MNSELHLFIIWEKARYNEKKILKDMREKFTILNVYEVEWSKKLFSKNLSRFYGEKLPKGSGKERHCGTGPFLLIVARDEKPTYGERHTSKGTDTLNVNMFDAKSLYRSWTGGGHKIHATNDPEETSHDLTLLLGINPQDFEKQHPTEWDGNVEKVKQDLVGANGWTDIKQLFYVLNASIPYVVLRNFECFPDEYHMDTHGDIDLLTTNYREMCYITNAKEVTRKKYRVYNEIRIAREEVLFDFRHVGDHYYDTKWEEAILNERVMDEGGFYKPDAIHYFYSLFYHAIVHKPSVSQDYKERLVNMSKEYNVQELTYDMFQDTKQLKGYMDEFMNERHYTYSEPKDLTVYFNTDIADTEISSKRTMKMKIDRTLSPYKKRVKKLIKR
ncbi:hypothetical protein [Salirhabdus salicampi]|uniref:hypothetical protein n=1 Tax=Salirhabdus salicampi TaxID=476102 RepID=UPI0020C29769|nr:hypothetical protein [Salirhabdus salicampi]MCP8617503.1 hypothetical protein [Salirhabdus salicampi]